jgi:hypothetical protein
MNALCAKWKQQKKKKKKKKKKKLSTQNKSELSAAWNE